MRRFLPLLLADIRFQWRYGFYGVYAVLSLAYVGIVRLVPAQWRAIARALTVFSDPAALGFFFIGAIVLFEKGERVLSALAVSPVGPLPYAVSKLVSLALVSTASGTLIQIAGGGCVTPSFLAGVFFGSAFCTAIGLSVAASVPTVNAFFVRSIPVGILTLAIGPVVWLGFLPEWLYWNPGTLMLSLLDTRPHTGALARLFTLPALVFWLVPACALAVLRSRRLFRAEALDDREGGMA